MATLEENCEIFKRLIKELKKPHSLSDTHTYLAHLESCADDIIRIAKEVEAVKAVTKGYAEEKFNLSKDLEEKLEEEHSLHEKFKEKQASIAKVQLDSLHHLERKFAKAKAEAETLKAENEENEEKIDSQQNEIFRLKLKLDEQEDLIKQLLDMQRNMQNRIGSLRDRFH